MIQLLLQYCFMVILLPSVSLMQLFHRSKSLHPALHYIASTSCTHHTALQSRRIASNTMDWLMQASYVETKHWTKAGRLVGIKSAKQSFSAVQAGDHRLGLHQKQLDTLLSALYLDAVVCAIKTPDLAYLPKNKKYNCCLYTLNNYRYLLYSEI